MLCCIRKKPLVLGHTHGRCVCDMRVESKRLNDSRLPYPLHLDTFYWHFDFRQRCWKGAQEYKENAEKGGQTRRETTKQRTRSKGQRRKSTCRTYFFLNFGSKEDRQRERRSRRSSADPNYRLPGRSKSKDDKERRDKSRVKKESRAAQGDQEANKIPRPPATSKTSSGIKMPDPRLVILFLDSNTNFRIELVDTAQWSDHVCKKPLLPNHLNHLYLPFSILTSPLIHYSL